MRVNGNILLNIGLGLAVAYCAILAVWLGVESRADHVKDTQPESFSAYVAVETPIVVPSDTPDSIEESAEPGQSKKSSQKREPALKAAVLQIVTNFEKADVTINGIPYPEYVEPGQEDGIILPAGGPYDVRVTYSGKTKAYNIYLRPYETRMLIVELSGFQGGGTPPPVSAPQAKVAEPEKKEETGKEPGKVTVYSKPAGAIIVDGTKMPEKTPGTVEVANGRHEVQVEYEGGKVSEKKIVRVRDGSRIKLFFRERTDAAE